jgi:hypothetical protein
MKNRSQLTREELLAEIEFAEAILDGCGADEGLTLWGRIASIKERLTQRTPDLWDSAPQEALSTPEADTPVEHLSTPPTSG